MGSIADHPPNKLTWFKGIRHKKHPSLHVNLICALSTNFDSRLPDSLCSKNIWKKVQFERNFFLQISPKDRSNFYEYRTNIFSPQVKISKKYVLKVINFVHHSNPLFFHFVELCATSYFKFLLQKQL